MDVELESIRECLEAGVPAPLASCDPDGTPHVSYIQQVQYLDSERVGTSRQAFNRALQMLAVNPFSQALIVCVATGQQYRLDLQYLHTDTRGEAFERMRAHVDALAAHTGTGSMLRLRGLDVHRVLRCTHLARERPPVAPIRAQLAPLERLARRLQQSTSYQEITDELLDALDDIFHIPYAVLFTVSDETGRLLATSASGEAHAVEGTIVELGTGLVGLAASRRRVTMTANLQRARMLAIAASERSDEDVTPASPGPGLVGARNAAAVPLIVGDELLGVLYLESLEPGAFTGPLEPMLHIIGAHAAAALAAHRGSDELTAHRGSGAPADTAQTVPTARGARPLQLVYYQADDTILCDSAYIVKGAPGRILWAMLTAHADSGRTEFTNRELRLDESLGLPAGHENLETRLLVLRRRLAAINCGVTLERVGRGRLKLRVQQPAQLTVVPTSGPMRGTASARS